MAERSLASEIGRPLARDPVDLDPELVERAALRIGAGGVAAIFAVAGGLALAYAWSDARAARRGGR